MGILTLNQILADADKPRGRDMLWIYRDIGAFIASTLLPESKDIAKYHLADVGIEVNHLIHNVLSEAQNEES